jgi:cell surface protein SprA
MLKYRYLLIVLFLGVINRAAAQEEDAADHRQWQPTQDPDSLYEVRYDDPTNQYLLYDQNTPKHGMPPVRIMNKEEYRKYQFNESLRKSWTNKGGSGATGSGTGEGDAVDRLIPSYKIKSELATALLGGNEIKIDLQGNIELQFGYKWQKSDNPTIPQEYRSHGIFDFKVNYQLNATGQIGNRIKVEFASGSDVNLSFQDRVKISYMAQGFGLGLKPGELNPGEDDIIQKIEAGNVSMPLSGSLITGSQTLFGIRTDLKYGNVFIETVISQQKGETSTINVQGGSQSTNFDILADKYDANRHFFIGKYFRENYNNALRYLPLIQSGISVTRIEVWITNKAARYETSRNVVALAAFATEAGAPNNKNNPLFNDIKQDERVRDMSTVNAALISRRLEQGKDFEKIENARRLNANEFSFNAQLGYISLNMALNNDEVLGVAYEYTVGGRAYRVGEFYDEVASPSVLLLKLLKGANISPRYNTWELMMKNVYSLETYQLGSEDFLLNVMYKDDELGTYVPYIQEGSIKNKPLITALNLDNSNPGGARFPDGRFDFVEGVTVQSQTGRIIFPVLEPFGRDMGKAIDGYKDSPTAPPYTPSATAQKYIYTELYDSTLVKARQVSYKNKFKLSGRYKASSGSEIILGAGNIPEGSVVVTAGGIKLVENVDYTVNYAMGRVQIINPVYLGSNVPLQVSLENMSMFSQISKTLIGANVKYNIMPNLKVGGTIMHLSERPLTQKVVFGEEPISNTIWGLNAAYQEELPILTKLVNYIPFIKTKAPSRIDVGGEFAHFIPGHHSYIGSDGASYIDDFEAAQLSIDLKQYINWALGSTPKFVTAGRGGSYFLGDAATADSADIISNGYRRSHIAWYTIDPLFLRNSTNVPNHIRDNPKTFQKNHYVREIAELEIFPYKDKIVGTNSYLPVLNVAYYPRERGSYNYAVGTNSRPLLNSDGTVADPPKNFGAISRALPITDFENANIEFLEFWLLDPFIYNTGSSGGKLVFNLGSVSEDVLRDSRKSFENGIPYPYDAAMMDETPFGLVPRVQSLTNTFDNNTAARRIQDVGLDGMDDANERVFFERKYQYISKLNDVGLTSDAYNEFYADPSNDDYHYYLGDDYDRMQLDILQRYKRYNMPENNSPIATGAMANSATTMPSTEDINKDNTLDELEQYYEYIVDLSPGAMGHVGSNYITDIRTVDVGDADYAPQTVKWYQFKIPVRSGEAKGNIEDFKSIKFMRMFLTGFSDSVFLRFAKLELKRGEWRKYEYSLVETQEGVSTPEVGTSALDISAVSIEENAGRQPVNYVLPPGVSRIVDNTSNQQYQRNEQSMMLTVKNLPTGTARAAYKTMNYDMRNFRRLQMHVHAEAVYSGAVLDNELSLFVRIGSDFQYNYYEYEIPLKVTPHGIYTDNQREVVWPSENRMDIELSKLTKLKTERNVFMKNNPGTMSYRTAYEQNDGKNIMRIVGNPNLGEVRTMMIGVRNPTNKNGNRLATVSAPLDAIVWVNELRFSDFDEGGGWAATGRITTNLADFGTATLAGSIMTAGFGGIDTRVSNQRQEQSFSYDLNTNLQLGKFFPDSIGVTLPFGFAYAESFITPKYNPLDPDILYKEALKVATAEERAELEELAVNYSKRRNFSFTNVRVVGTKRAQALGPIAPGNFTAGYMYTESLKHDVNIARDYSVEHRINGGYAWSPKPTPLMPFKPIKSTSPWLKIVKDITINPYPGQYGFNTTYADKYSEYITRPFYEGMEITPIIWRERTWDRNYTLGWDITSNLKFNFSATNNSRQDISIGQPVENAEPWEPQTKDENSGWRNTHYGHNYSLSYAVPLNKLPILSWTNTTLSYRATYDWESAPLTTGLDMPDPGNSLRNSNNFQANLTLNFLQLYNKSPFLKDVYQKFDGRSKPKVETKDVTFTKEKLNFVKGQKLAVKHNLKNATGIKAQVQTADGRTIAAATSADDNGIIDVTVQEDVQGGTVVLTGKAPVTENPFIYAGKFTLRTMMMLKNANLSYTRGGETSLAGYNPKTKYMGLDFSNQYYMAPGYAFILGSQSAHWQGNFYGDATEYMLTDARRNGWLTGDTTLTLNPFAMRNNTSLTMKVSFEPIRDLRIDLNAMQTHTYSRSWYDNTLGSPMEQGSFSTSTISIGTAFEDANTLNNFKSASYDKFRDVRLEIAQSIARQKWGNDYPLSDFRDTMSFPLGYSGVSQDVMIPAFSAAYMGNSVDRSMVNYTKFLSQLPLPNWQVTYSGLSNIKALKPVIKSATLTHSYKSVYTIGNFATNTNYVEDPGGVNDFGDVYTRYSVSNVSLTENIVLGGIDVTWVLGIQSRFELRKNRRVELSMSNNQIIENNSWETTVGGGYSVALPQIFSFEKASAQANCTFRADFTLRDDQTLIRKIAEETTQITDGKRNIAIKFTADYLLLKDLTFRLYFDWMQNNPYVSTVSTLNWSAGFSLRYVLGM